MVVTGGSLIISLLTLFVESHSHAITFDNYTMVSMIAQHGYYPF